MNYGTALRAYLSWWSGMSWPRLHGWRSARRGAAPHALPTKLARWHDASWCADGMLAEIFITMAAPATSAAAASVNMRAIYWQHIPSCTELLSSSCMYSYSPPPSRHTPLANSNPRQFYRIISRTIWPFNVLFRSTIFPPALPTGGEGIMFSLRPLTLISRDAIPLYLMYGFQWVILNFFFKIICYALIICHCRQLRSLSNAISIRRNLNLFNSLLFSFPLTGREMDSRLSKGLRVSPK